MLGEDEDWLPGEHEGLLLVEVEVEGVVVGVRVPTLVREIVFSLRLQKFSFGFPFQSHNGCLLQGPFSVKSEQETKGFLLGEVEGWLLGDVEGCLLGEEGCLLGEVEGCLLGEDEGWLLGEVEGVVVGVRVPKLVGEIVFSFRLQKFLFGFPFHSHSGCLLQGHFSVKSEQETKGVVGS